MCKTSQHLQVREQIAKYGHFNLCYRIFDKVPVALMSLHRLLKSNIQVVDIDVVVQKDAFSLDSIVFVACNASLVTLPNLNTMPVDSRKCYRLDL